MTVSSSVHNCSKLVTCTWSLLCRLVSTCCVPFSFVSEPKARELRSVGQQLCYRNCAVHSIACQHKGSACPPTAVMTALYRLGVSCQNSVSQCHIRWLGLHAFQTVLTHKQARYTACLGRLQQELSLSCYQHLKSQLAGVVAPCRSSCFQRILF